jgi:hypothetical protein
MILLRALILTLRRFGTAWMQALETAWRHLPIPLNLQVNRCGRPLGFNFGNYCINSSFNRLSDDDR